jgi:hypothetical protein
MSDELFDSNDLDEDFDDARSAFVKSEDLEGRLLLVQPHETGSRKSTLPGADGKEYEFVVCDVHVLDGEATDMVVAGDVLEDFQFAGVNVVGQLKPKIRRGKKVLGRLAKKKAQQRGFSDSWILGDPTDADKAKARKYLAALAEKSKKEDLFD